MNLTVVVAVYGLKFHVLNFPLSNFNGKPKAIDTYGDDRKERPLNAVTKKLESIAVELEIKPKQLFYVMRIALTGLEVTPGGATEIASLLGKEETLKRLDFALSLLA